MKKENIINLTPKQKNYLYSIQWLLDPHDYLSEGRSFLMAIAYINLAIKYPNTSIDVFDHRGYKDQHRKLLLTTISDLLKKNKKLLKKTVINLKQNSFFIKKGK